MWALHGRSVGIQSGFQVSTGQGTFGVRQALFPTFSIPILPRLRVLPIHRTGSGMRANSLRQHLRHPSAER